MFKRSVLLCCTLCLTCYTAIQARQLTQVIKGIVVDKDSRRPLEGATVFIGEDSILQSAITNAAGEFILTGISTGRHRIRCTYSGYSNFSTDNNIVTSSRALELILELEKLYYEQEAVLVKTTVNPKQPVNRSLLVSARSFTPEETSRYAASVNDPSRMAMSFPGVQPTRDARSDLIIRGNAASTLLWRLEGVDIPNPNHFARKGSSGGGITIFSSSMLANSDFSSGAFSAEYGDAMAGVFDMHFRKGNDKKNAYTFKAGLIGLDFSAEGPIQKGRSSFLLNYRYSTLGILNTLGFHLTDEREDNNFQDLSFNLNFTSANKKSSLNIWGMGGLSKEDFSATDNTAEWDEYDDYAIYDFRTNMGALGISHHLQTGKAGLLKTSIAIMDQKVSFLDDTLNLQKQAYTINDELYKNNRISFSLQYHTPITRSIKWKTGAFINRIGYQFTRDAYDFATTTFKNNLIDGNGSTFLWQPYTQFTFHAGSKLLINAGLHVLYLALNKTKSIEPRLAIQYRVNPRHSLSLAAGLHGKTLPLGTYFYKAPDGSLPNKNLELMKAAHYVLAHDWLAGKNWRIRTEAYVQKLTAIPVVNDVNRTFWLLNMTEGYAQEALANSGTGTNKGIDITVERFFSKQWFLLSSFSFFNSTYAPLSGVKYNTQYNSRTAGSFTMGKEWSWKKDKVFTVGGKVLYNGGMPISPLLQSAPVNSREPVLDETRSFTLHVPAYFRMDTRISLRKDRHKKSWVLALDIQNLLGIKNVDAFRYRYDPTDNLWIYRKSSGFVPVISYQIDF